MQQSSKVGDRYNQLQSAAEVARYQPGNFPYTEPQVSPGGVLYNKHYQVLADWAAKELGIEMIAVPKQAPTIPVVVGKTSTMS